MKALFKRIVNFLLKHIFALGIGKILHKINQNKITIVSMHGVMKEHDNVLWKPLRGQLDPVSLERVIKVLSNKYTFISLEQALGILSGQEKPVKNGLVFTLDDGYWNNLHYAGPIFEKHKITPTIFVATLNVDEGVAFWFDRLDYALQQLNGKSYTVSLNNQYFEFDLSSRASLQKSYSEFRSILKGFYTKDEDMRTLLNSISNLIELKTNKSLADILHKDDWCRISTWDELKSVSDKGTFIVGSHTVDHIRISLVKEKIAIEQLRESKSMIERKLVNHCKYFCYPNGSFNLKTANLVKNSGYLLAVTTKNGINSIGDDLMTLNRFNLPNKSAEKDILYALSTFKV